LIATSGKPLKDIAKQIGTTTEQLKRWLKDPDFAERVLLEKEDYLEQIRRVGIASRIHRIRNYNEIFDRLDSAIRAREKDHPSGVMRKKQRW
jgi:tyrosyl-tRNA synthetase